VARSPIHQLAHRHAVWLIKALTITLLVCGGVLALNRTFFYNWWVGPVPFTSALADDPGLHRWVRAEGPVLPTGLTRVATVKMFKGLVKTQRIADNYYAMLVGDRLLIVRSGSEMQGTPTLTGRLEELPGDVRNRLGVGEGAKRLYPWMLDAESGYSFWNANLFVWIFTPLTALVLLILLDQLRDLVQPHRSVMIKSLTTYGDPKAVAAEIDAELRSQGIDGSTGNAFLTRSWLIGFTHVVKLRDLMAIGFAPDGTGSWELTAWRRGERSSETLRVPEPEAKALLERVRVARPAAIVTNVKEFEARWKADQLGCEAAVDAAVAPGAAPDVPPVPKAPTTTPSASAPPAAPAAPAPGTLAPSPRPARSA
jgi:hypothetical protein